MARRHPCAALLGVAALLACSEPDATRSGPPNLLLLSLDTVRADHLGAYGHDRDPSPFLDELAAEGVLFENATSTAAWTLPAHASLFTGAYPTRHGVLSVGHELAPRQPTLAQLLARRGYATAAVFNLGALERLKRGFDEVWLVPSSRSEQTAAEHVSSRAGKWLAGAPQPWFLFLHYYDAHSPYLPAPEHEQRFARPYTGPVDGSTEQLVQARLGTLELALEDAGRLRDLYAAEIHQLDAALRLFFEGLEAEGRVENTLVVVTSDHGEEFLEHGSFLHGRTLHQELVRVPLIFWGAGVPAGLRVSAPVSLVDVLPTLLAAAGAASPRTGDGIDLAGFWNHPAETDRKRAVFAEADHWLGRSDGHFRRAVRQGDLTLHVDGASGAAELYDLASDPGEQVDLAARSPALAKLLRVLLDPFLPEAGPGAAPAVPEHLVEELRELGYLEEPGAAGGP